MAEITRELAADTHGQFLFVITSGASTCCFAEDFQIIFIYAQRVNAMRQYDSSVIVQVFQNGQMIGWL